MASTSVQQVFDLTIHLIDSVSDDGLTDTEDTQEYKNRTLGLLNTMQQRLYRYSDTYKLRRAGKRPVLPMLESFEDTVQLDDYIAQDVMPYGLAALLLLAEDPTQANFFQQTYEELIRGLSQGLPIESEDIEDMYGGFEYTEFGRWS